MYCPNADYFVTMKLNLMIAYPKVPKKPEADMKGKFKMIFSLSSVLIFIFFGCGSKDGGGGDGTKVSSTATPTVTIDLSEIKSFDEASASPGTALSFHTTGSFCDNLGCDSIEATISTAISQPTVSNNYTYRVKQEMVVYTFLTSSTTQTSTSTSYIDQNGYLVKVVYSDGSMLTTTSEVLLPANAMVGDAGNYVTSSFSDGATETVVWRTDPGDITGEAKIVFTITKKDLFNNLVMTQEMTHTIKQNGTISYLFRTDHYADGTIVRLSGQRI